MIHSDFVLLIFSCKKYAYKANKQKETWLSNFKSIPYFHVIGDTELTKSYEINADTHTLRVRVEDDYNSLPKKVISAYEAINNEYIFKYIFKTDDDQNLTNKEFFNIIQKLLTNKLPSVHYGGNIVTIDKPYLSEYHRLHPELPANIPLYETKYCSGRFYLLSNLAIEYLLTKKANIQGEFLEDYAIGYNLDDVLKKHMLHIQTDKYFVDFDFTQYLISTPL
jgi:hypothetical protein